MSFIISVFKDSSLSAIKKKLIMLYILNVTDIIFTLLLINTGMFMEANSIMAPVINNKLLSLFIKIVVPLLLLVGVTYRMRKASRKQLYQANVIISACLIFYILINTSHIIWLILYSML